MRRIVLLTVVLAGFAVGSVAQQRNASTQNSSSESSQFTVRGCLTGALGQYRLVDESHSVYMVVGSDKQLSGLDGQRVEVAGKLQERIPPKEKQTESSFSQPERRLTVATISKISDSCEGASE